MSIKKRQSPVGSRQSSRLSMLKALASQNRKTTVAQQPQSTDCRLPTHDCHSFCFPRSSPAWWLLRSDKTRSHPELGRQTLQRQWYYVSRPGRVGRCQACQERTKPHHKPQIKSGPHGPLLRLRPKAQTSPKKAGQSKTKSPKRNSINTHDAGWSSPVARQAHNLKVAGSNPAPASSKKPAKSATWRA